MEQFTMSVSPLSPTAILARVAGSLDAGTAIRLEMELAPWLARPELKDVVMEVPDLNFVSSSGLRVCMIILKRVTPRRGNLFMVGAGSQVAGVIKMAGMGGMLRFRDTVQECEI